MSPKYKSKAKKNKPQRIVKQVILIVCEGKCTEVNYINGIKKELRLSNIQIEGPFTNPQTLFNETKKYLESNPEIKKAYCVFDRDNHTTFLQVLKHIRQYNKEYTPQIVSIISNPCFELWIYLHCRYSTHAFHTNARGKSASDALTAEIRKHFPQYKKNRADLYQMLKEKTSTAIKHAERLSDYQKNDPNQNPYTDVHKLVNMLCKLK